MSDHEIKLDIGYFYIWKDKDGWKVCTEDCEGIKSGNVGDITVLSISDYNGKEIGLTVCNKTVCIATNVVDSLDEYIKNNEEYISRRYAELCFAPENISAEAIIYRLRPLLKSNQHVRQCVTDLLKLYLD